MFKGKKRLDQLAETHKNKQQYHNQKFQKPNQMPLKPHQKSTHDRGNNDTPPVAEPQNNPTSQKSAEITKDYKDLIDIYKSVLTPKEKKDITVSGSNNNTNKSNLETSLKEFNDRLNMLENKLCNIENEKEIEKTTTTDKKIITVGDDQSVKALISIQPLSSTANNVIDSTGSRANLKVDYEQNSNLQNLNNFENSKLFVTTPGNSSKVTIPEKYKRFIVNDQPISSSNNNNQQHQYSGNSCLIMNEYKANLEPSGNKNQINYNKEAKIAYSQSIDKKGSKYDQDAVSNNNKFSTNI